VRSKPKRGSPSRSRMTKNQPGASPPSFPCLPSPLHCEVEAKEVESGLTTLASYSGSCSLSPGGFFASRRSIQECALARWINTPFAVCHCAALRVDHGRRYLFQQLPTDTSTACCLPGPERSRWSCAPAECPWASGAARGCRAGSPSARRHRAQAGFATRARPELPEVWAGRSVGTRATAARARTRVEAEPCRIDDFCLSRRA